LRIAGAHAPERIPAFRRMPVAMPVRGPHPRPHSHFAVLVHDPARARAPGGVSP